VLPGGSSQYMLVPGSLWPSVLHSRYCCHPVYVKLQMTVTQWCLVLMIGYIQSCKITPDLEQLHPSTTTGQQDDTTVPAVLLGDSLLICFLTASSQANLLLLLLPE